MRHVLCPHASRSCNFHVKPPPWLAFPPLSSVNVHCSPSVTLLNPLQFLSSLSFFLPSFWFKCLWFSLLAVPQCSWRSHPCTQKNTGTHTETHTVRPKATSAFIPHNNGSTWWLMALVQWTVGWTVRKTYVCLSMMMMMKFTHYIWSQRMNLFHFGHSVAFVFFASNHNPSKTRALMSMMSCGYSWSQEDISHPLIFNFASIQLYY